jgi:hypothetical protein
MKFISNDLPVTTDSNGNALIRQSISGLFKSGPPILGFAQRIGLAGTEPTLPNCTYWPTDTVNGWLMVRGDAVHGGTAWFRYGALQ